MLIIVFIAGILVGLSIATLIFQRVKIGVLYIVSSSPEDDPFLTLEAHKNVHNISSMKYVLLKVDSQNYIPRK